MKPTNFDLALERATDRTRARQEAQEALDLAKHREHVAKVLLDPRKAMNNYKRQQATRRENLLDPTGSTSATTRSSPPRPRPSTSGPIRP